MPSQHQESKTVPRGQLKGKIFAYHPSFTGQISHLFHLSVSQIVHPRYNPSQLNAWSQAPRSMKHWQNILKGKQTWLWLDDTDGAVQGFITLDSNVKHRGHIEHLYVQPQVQGQGLARDLYAVAEQFARANDYHQLSCDASYLSRGFFEKQGFIFQQKSFQSKLNQVITGFYMEKIIASARA